MREEIKTVKDLSDKVEGWLELSEGELLYDLAKGCRGTGAIVEIGSWKGKSTVWIAQGSKKGSRTKVFAVDPHVGSPEHQAAEGSVWTLREFEENMRKTGCSDIVEPIVKTSEAAAPGINMPVEFVFVDGAHEYEMVKLDFELWFPKLIEGGIVAFHDTIGWPGPKRLVNELAAQSQQLSSFRFIHSIAYARKVRQNSALVRLQSRYVLLLKVFYELLYSMQPPKVVRRGLIKFLSFIQ
jgi:predicted O-methyltransferase YrrM